MALFDDGTPATIILAVAGPSNAAASHSYTDGPPLTRETLHYESPHGLGEVITAIAQTGFTIESLTETCLLPWRRWSLMVRTDNGWWAMSESEPRFPVMYGLKVIRR